MDVLEVAGVGLVLLALAGRVPVDLRAAGVAAGQFHIVAAERIGGLDDDAPLGLSFEVGNFLSQLVGEMLGHFGADADFDFDDVVIGRGQLEVAHHAQGDRLAGHDRAGPVAVGAARIEALLEARPEALAGHFDQPETADLQHLALGAVGLEDVADFLLELAAVFFLPQIDEVDHDHPAHVAQPELSADFLGGHEVQLQRVGLRILVRPEAAGVHVDGDQRLGLVDHQRAALFQLDLPGVNLLNLILDAELLEESALAGVDIDLTLGARHGQVEKLQNLHAIFLAVAYNPCDVAIVHVADGPHDQVGLLVDFVGGLALVRAFLDFFPEAVEVGQVALEFLLGPIHAGRSHDHASVVGHVELIEGFLEFLADFLILDLPADAAVAHAGHHHQQPARQGEVGRQRWALRADPLLGHLDDDFLASLETGLDGRAVFVRAASADRLGVFALGEILRVDVGDVQKAVLHAAEIDEGCLDRRLDVGDFAFVDAADLAGGTGALGVKLFEAVAVKDGDAALLALDGIDQHGLAHGMDVLGLGSVMTDRCQRPPGSGPVGPRRPIRPARSGRGLRRAWPSGPGEARRESAAGRRRHGCRRRPGGGRTGSSAAFARGGCGGS